MVFILVSISDERITEFFHFSFVLVDDDLVRYAQNDPFKSIEVHAELRNSLFLPAYEPSIPVPTNPSVLGRATGGLDPECQFELQSYNFVVSV